MIEESKDMQDDPLELEDKYHDVDAMCAISVIENEITYLKSVAQKMPKGDEKSYYLSKIESLEFGKDNLETSVQSGIITPEKYVVNIKKY